MTPRRSIAFAFAVLFSLSGTCLPAQDKAKLVEHPFFKALIGEWKAAGELKGADGNVVKISEEWVGKVSDEGELVIEGSRTVNDNPPQKYRWAITHNPTTDLYEAVQTDVDNPKNAVRFEGNVTGEPAVLELKAQFGNGGGSVTVTDTFSGADTKVLETKVVFLKDTGEVNLEGTIKNERVK